MKASDFLSKEEQEEIVQAIGIAEHATSGEIRVHIETSCKKGLLDRAAFIFSKLKMHRTKLRNGVLFYIALKDHKFAILGDKGINAKVSKDFWEQIKTTVLEYFKEEKYADGLSKGIIMAGEQLKVHFPYQQDDTNELSDDISFGK